jgi:molybdopterin molybdotransferase
MRPGKPLLFATKGRTRVFGLPGNPVSSTVGARFFVDAAIRRLGGQADETAMALPLAAEARKKPGFSMLQKARIAIDAEGRLVVRLLKGQESFKTAPLLAANAWAVLPEAAESIPAGTPVSVYPLRPGASVVSKDRSP